MSFVPYLLAGLIAAAPGAQEKDVYSGSSCGTDKMTFTNRCPGVIRVLNNRCEDRVVIGLFETDPEEDIDSRVLHMGNYSGRLDKERISYESYRMKFPIIKPDGSTIVYVYGCTPPMTV